MIDVPAQSVTRQAQWIRRWPWLVLSLGLVVLPLGLPNAYIMRLVILAFIWIAVNQCWNLVLGVAGIFSLAQLALFAIGGYTSAMLALYLGWPVWATMVIGALASVLASLLIGLPTLRLRGVYVVLLTLAFHEIIRVMIGTDQSGLTGGAFGLYNVPSFGAEVFGKRGEITIHYYLALILSAITVLAIYRVTRSPVGLAFQALRDSEGYAISRGVSPFRYRMMVFAISAFFTGLIGAFYAHYLRTISPSVLSFGLMMNLMAMIVIGGWGSFSGPILGTILLVGLSEALHSVEQFRLILLGLAMAAVVVLFPSGLVSVVSDVIRRFRRWMDETEQPAAPEADQGGPQ